MGEKEYRSLSGKSYQVFEHELHLVNQDKEIYCSILSTDLFYDQDKQSIKRFMISNTVDDRFYQEMPNLFDGSDVKRPGGDLSRRSKIMRDPYEFINFFK